jgi:DNA-directed RNA polymerase subunit RPC12/RpoP
MYTCLRCGRNFEEPAEEWEWLSTDPYYEGPYYCCPFCGDTDFQEMDDEEEEEDYEE